MGEKPIVEKSNTEEIPDDGRISLGEEYSHRKVPLEIDVPASGEHIEHGLLNWDFYHVQIYEADSRGRVTIPASVREEYDRIHWIVSEPALEHGDIGAAYQTIHGNNE